MPMSLISANVLDDLVDAARNAPAGPLVEVGVYKGGSAARLAEVAREQGRTLWLFDTFSGTPFSDPAKGDWHGVGDFGDTSFESVAAAVPDAILVPGVFPETLPSEVQGVGFAHLDCDQYRSVRESALALAPRMAKGGIMWFDDYDHLLGARNAVDGLYAGRVHRSRTGKAVVVF